MGAAMRAFCTEFSEQQKVEIDFETHDLPSSLSPPITLCLFRVLQEAVRNSAKHSGVSAHRSAIVGNCRMKFISRLRTPAQALKSKRQRRAEGSDSSAWRSG